MPPIKPPVPQQPAMAVASSALRAQQARMRIIAENIANSDATAKTPGGDPYRRQVAVFKPKPIEGGQGVVMAQVVKDKSPFTMEYNPSHPAADANGYVKRPNVEDLIETMDMRDAQRAYESNINVIETARAMQSRTLEILKK